MDAKVIVGTVIVFVVCVILIYFRMNSSRK